MLIILDLFFVGDFGTESHGIHHPFFFILLQQIATWNPNDPSFGSERALFCPVDL